MAVLPVTDHHAVDETSTEQSRRAPVIGSAFSGYAGLDIAVARVFDADPGWHIEFDAAPSKILESHFDVPNYGDVTAVDWSQIPSADIFTGGYPCFPTGTLVLTREGWKAIEDVIAGDVVFTHRNRWRRVIRNWGSRQGRTVTVKGQGHEGLVATDNHKFPAREKRRIYPPAGERGHGYGLHVLTDEIQRVEAKDLQGKFWASPIDFPAEEVPATEGVDVDLASPSVLWVLGKYLADGSPNSPKKNGKHYSLRIGDGYGAEAEELEARLTAAGFTFGISEERTTKVFQLNSVALTEWVKLHFGHGDTKTVPPWAYGLTLDQRRALFAGYIHGDGHALDNGGVRFNTVCKTLAISMRLLAQSIGYFTSVRKVEPDATKVIEGRTVNQKPWWAVTCNLESTTAVRDDGSQWGKVRSVTETGRVETVWNLEVADDNSYMVEGILAFNCQPFSHAGARSGTEDARHLFPHFAAGIESQRPKVVVAENVRGHLTLGFDVVLAEFSRLGYDVQWMLIKASDVGAPHARARLFIMATDPGQVGPLPVKGSPVTELVDEQWCEVEESLFGREPWSGSWPNAGRLVGATVYDNTDVLGDVGQAISAWLGAGSGGEVGSAGLLPTPTTQPTTGNGHARHLGGEIKSLLPTPRATRGGSTTEMSYALGGERTDEDRTQGQVLLPTPTAAIGSGGQTSRSGDRKDELLLAGVAEAVDSGQLLPTPTAAIGSGGPDFARATREGSGGDDLQTAVHRLGGQHEARPKLSLLPTPVASDGKTPPTVEHSRVREGERALPLSEKVTLLPAPVAGGGTAYMSGSNRDTWRPGLEKAVEGYVPVLHQGRPDFTKGAAVAMTEGSSALLPTPTPNMLRNEEEPDEWVARRREVFERTGTRHGLPLTVAATSIAEGEPLYIGDKQTLSYRDEEDDRDAEVQLLPTPTSQQSGSTPEQHLARKPGREVVTCLEIITDHDLLETGGRLEATEGSTTLAGYEQWGPYGPAVLRWERVTGVPAPSPTAELKPGGPQRLSPRFVEWMMGLPAGWVTDTDLTRAEQLKALGNGVLPLQAEVALRLMLATR